MTFNVSRLIGRGQLKRLNDLLRLRHRADPNPSARARADIDHVFSGIFDQLARHYTSVKSAAVHALVRLQRDAFDFYDLALGGRTPDIARLEKILRDMDVEMEKLSRSADAIAGTSSKLDSIPLPAKKVTERPIPRGGISIEQRIAQGGKPGTKVLANPERYYFKDHQYHRRGEPDPDFSTDAPATMPSGPPLSRPIPARGLTVEEAVAAGYKPSDRMQKDPDRYYHDFDTKQFTRRPEVSPDFGDGSQRKIPCFVPGTLVRLASGWLPIEQIAPGHLVLSADELIRDPEEQPVVATSNSRTIRIVRIKIGTEEIATTRNHRFLLERSGWLAASTLRASDRLETASRKPVEIVSIRNEVVDELPTYNLEIANYHTYFVGHASVMVHNEGDERVWKVYVGYTTDGSIYVGRARTDLMDRQSKHLADARQEPTKYGFKEGIRLDQVPGMDGLTLDEGIWHERRVYDEQKKLYGDRVKNIQAPPTGDGKIFELRSKYC